MNLKTLIVDDDKLTQLIHKKVLERAAITDVELFSDGEQALNFLLTMPEMSYLILLDINMPVMDGWQFLDAMNQRFTDPNIHVVMVTSSIDRKDRLRANAYKPVLNFVEKPLTAENLNLMNRFIQSNHHFPLE